MQYIFLINKSIKGLVFFLYNIDSSCLIICSSSSCLIILNDLFECETDVV